MSIKRVEKVIITIQPDDEKKGSNVKVDFDFTPKTQDGFSKEVMANDPVLRATGMIMATMRGEE